MPRCASAKSGRCAIARQALGAGPHEVREAAWLRRRGERGQRSGQQENRSAGCVPRFQASSVTCAYVRPILQYVHEVAPAMFQTIPLDLLGDRTGSMEEKNTTQNMLPTQVPQRPSSSCGWRVFLSWIYSIWMYVRQPQSS